MENLTKFRNDILFAVRSMDLRWKILILYICGAYVTHFYYYECERYQRFNRVITLRMRSGYRVEFITYFPARALGVYCKLAYIFSTCIHAGIAPGLARPPGRLARRFPITGTWVDPAWDTSQPRSTVRRRGVHRRTFPRSR